MFLVSWNINGIRSAEKQFLDFMSSYQPDLLMLQEVRAFPDDISFLLKCIPGYSVEFNYSKRPGYSGTALYYKDNLGLSDISFSLNNEILDSEGRTIVCKYNDKTIINFYTPNGNSKPERLEFKLKFYTEIKKYLEDMLQQKKSIIVGGDLNVAHTEIDLFSPKTNTRMSGFLPEERNWFSCLLDIGFLDTFRIFNKTEGNYTWWHMRDPKRELNRGWRYDYFLVSKDLKDNITNAKILKDVYGSDHCPIVVEIGI